MEWIINFILNNWFEILISYVLFCFIFSLIQLGYRTMKSAKTYDGYYRIDGIGYYVSLDGSNFSKVETFKVWFIYYFIYNILAFPLDFFNNYLLLIFYYLLIAPIIFILKKIDKRDN